MKADSDAYITTVLSLYLELPDTPLRTSAQDLSYARQLYERGVPLHQVESAFLLASLRRLLRPPDASVLSPIRSMAYFQPVINELLSNPAPDNYLDYLRRKMQHALGKKTGSTARQAANVQKTTFFDDR